MEDLESQASSVAFDLLGSIFEPRSSECESKAYVNEMKIRRKEMKFDWVRGTDTRRFAKFLTKFDYNIKNSSSTVEEVKDELRKVYLKNCVVFQQTYQHYAIKGLGMSGYGTGATCIHENAYHKFLKDVQGEDAVEDDMVFQNLVRIFMTVNIDEDKVSGQNDKFNFNNCLMKGEWVETIARVAVILYGVETPVDKQGKVVAVAGEEANEDVLKLKTVVGCLEKLFLKIEENLPVEAVVDDDEYRLDRLYTREVNEVLMKYKHILAGLFVVYPVSDNKMRTKKADLKLEYFGLDDFERMLGDSGMYTHGLNRSDSKAAFLQARMIVSDEIGHRDKEVSITQVDLYEALCRLADRFYTSAADVANGIYEGEDASGNVELFMQLMLKGLAMAWNGELRCMCHGHSLDQKKFASLKQYMDAPVQEGGGL